ncbi:hypothetical protein GMB45_16155, partial [Turicibacter sanguinis]|nr:hypothetical protein [Turicibacter sanguinis]
MSISIEIQKSGFPIKLGTVERWFDTSAESLTRFHDMETEATKRLNEFQRQIVESNIGKDIEEDNITIDTVKGAVDLEKKYLEIQYDLLLGDGTFAELYDLYPDYLVLQETLEKVSEMI